MRCLALFIALGLSAGPAAATEFCDDLWFTRNAVFDRAGYCFGSPLGQTVFDNADCTGTDVALAPEAKALADLVRGREAEFGCKTDSNRVSLALDDIAWRRQLAAFPVADELQSGCLGWTGPDTPLFAGHGPATAVIGRIAPGDFVSHAHVPVGHWTYVTVWDANWSRLKSAGWHDFRNDEAHCQAWAG